VPRFYFDLYNSVGLVTDEGGRELPDLAVVRREALKGIRSIIAADVQKGELDLTGNITIRDMNRAELLVIRFDEAVRIKGRWIPPEAH
jgi:hypothetical protein